MRHLAAALGALFLVATSAASAQTAGEQLFVPPPKGWVMAFHDTQGDVELTELVPAGQSAKDWAEMLAVRIDSAKPTKQPQQVLKQQLDEITAACESVGAGPINPASENGYQTAMRAIACPKSKELGKGELSLIKVLQGRDRTYVISRAWRGDPFEKDHLPVPAETTKQWLIFMSQVILCDSRDPVAHLCPGQSASPKPAQPAQ